MKQNTTLGRDKGLALLLAGCTISAATFWCSSRLLSSLVQAIFLLISMSLLFYSSHPLGHYLTASRFRVRVEHFYLGRSEFRRLRFKQMRAIGRMLPTIGTRLNHQDLSSLTFRKRGYIFGAGAIFSCALIAMELLVSFAAKFQPVSLGVGSVFVLLTVATELAFGTEAGDLSKMLKQFALKDPKES